MLRRLHVRALTLPDVDRDFCPLLRRHSKVQLATVPTCALSLREEPWVDSNRLPPKGSTSDQRCLLPHPLLLDLASSGEISPSLGKARKLEEREERVGAQDLLRAETLENESPGVARVPPCSLT